MPLSKFERILPLQRYALDDADERVHFHAPRRVVPRNIKFRLFHTVRCGRDFLFICTKFVLRKGDKDEKRRKIYKTIF